MTSRTDQAKRLPAPTPGQEVTIPLELLPIWLAAHRLEAMSRGQVGKAEEVTGLRKAAGVLWVKRSQ